MWPSLDTAWRKMISRWEKRRMSRKLRKANGMERGGTIPSKAELMDFKNEKETVTENE